MRERKYVKFRTDMYADTKFKIIDMKPERDVIHYVWNRIVLLAGKVNLEGELFLSKSIPYTIETLAIEFNRGIAEVKLSLELLMELEMIELTEGKIYRVKNFAKHQNIKVKEKEILTNKVEAVKDVYVPENEELKAEINEDKDSIKVDKSIEEEKSRDDLQKEIPVTLEMNKVRRRSKKKRDEIICSTDIDEENNDDSIFRIYEGVRPLSQGENSISEWSFG